MFFQNKGQFESVKKKPIPYGGGFDSSAMLKKIQELEQESLAPGFWDDRNGAEKLFSELNALKDSYYPWKELIDHLDEMAELIDLYSEEPDNPEEEAQINEQIEELARTYQELKLRTLLDGKFDKNDCFLTIHAGAGGNEASDWANMLMRMYLRYCERNGSEPGFGSS